jgi:hypothetical protein
MATAHDVGRIATSLPRTDEVVVHDRLKYRIGRIVYAALSRDESILGFAFPKEARLALVAAEPDVFLLPGRSDERYNWVQAYLEALDIERLRELLINAWLMVVPKRVGVAHLAELADAEDADPGSPH